MSKDEKPIHYEPHPVSPERKAELIAKGVRIVDVAMAPAGEAESDEARERAQLIEEFKRISVEFAERLPTIHDLREVVAGAKLSLAMSKDGHLHQTGLPPIEPDAQKSEQVTDDGRVPESDERAALIAELKAKGVQFDESWPTDELRALTITPVDDKPAEPKVSGRGKAKPPEPKE